MGDSNMEQMLRTIEVECQYTASVTGRRILEDRVMAAMARVPREEFVPEEIKPYAYDNRALPIGEGQTISQPFIVALMTDLLQPKEDSLILEIGTGSGYQAAVLSEIVQKVYSIEIVAPLAELAASRLRRLGYANVEIKSGDGYLGWPEHAPFDGIIVTAAASQVPPPLTEQLKPGARLIIPVGEPYMHQELMMIERDRKGDLHTRKVLDVAFVPLTRGKD